LRLIKGCGVAQGIAPSALIGGNMARDIAEDPYAIGKVVSGGLAFILGYLYCISQYSFLFGFGLGWIPSLIIAYVAVLVWPLFEAFLGLGILGFIAFFGLWHK
jgi:hypothetical protein